MTHAELFVEALIDYETGDPWPMLGLIDYLVNERNIPLARLLSFAKRRFGLDTAWALNTLNKLF